VRTWANAVTTAETPEEWIAALRAHAGARMQADAELREWAFAQTAHAQNGPLWDRIEALGIESGRLGSERGTVVNTVGTPQRSRRKRRVRTPDSAG
jgi:hypothetical protein